MTQYMASSSVTLTQNLTRNILNEASGVAWDSTSFYESFHAKELPVHVMDFKIR